MWSCYSTFGVISRGGRWLAASFSFAGVASFSPFAQLRSLRGTGATLLDGSTFCLTESPHGKNGLQSLFADGPARFPLGRSAIKGLNH